MQLFAINLTVLNLICLVLATNNENKVKFILDYIKFQNKPTKLAIWKNCFETCEMLELMGKSEVFMKISRKDSLSSDEFKLDPHHWLFVIDMTCTNETENLIEKVCIFYVFFFIE